MAQRSGPNVELILSLNERYYRPPNPGTLIHPFNVHSLEKRKVRDPIGLSEDVFREVANEIEQRVMRLVLSLRVKQQKAI